MHYKKEAMHVGDSVLVHVGVNLAYHTEFILFARKT